METLMGSVLANYDLFNCIILKTTDISNNFINYPQLNINLQAFLTIFFFSLLNKSLIVHVFAFILHPHNNDVITCRINTVSYNSVRNVGKKRKQRF